MTPTRFHAIVTMVIAVSVALGPAARADTLTGLKPSEPQPTAEQLVPGLAVE